jgi:tetratricopeptide (TPR) repeat protein
MCGVPGRRSVSPGEYGAYDAVVTCSRCGAKIEGLAVAKTFFFVSETDMDRLVSLMRGDLDVARCPSCVAPLGATSSIVAILPAHGTIAFVLGELMRNRRAEFFGLNWHAMIPGNPTPRLVEVAHASALRRIVVGVLAETLAPMNDLARAVGGADRILHERWRAFTPRLFAAARLAATNEIAGLRYGVPGAGPANHPTLASLVTPERFEPDERLAALTLLQGSVLVRLCEEWTARIAARGDPSDGLTFEDDLATYVDGGPDFKQLAAAFEVFEGAHRQEFAQRLSPYVLEAVRASIHVHLDEPNVQAQRWALLFFMHELVLRGRQPMPPGLAASAISADRAEATVGYDEAWHAVTALLHETTGGTLREHFPPDVGDWLRQIATKAGHPNVLQAAVQFHARSPINTVGEVLDLLWERASHDAVTADEFVALARLHGEFLVVQRRFGDLETVALTLLDLLDGGDGSLARVDSWLTGAFNRGLQPARVLARIGDRPRPWEAGIGADAKVSLWHERATALEAVGRQADALALRQEIMRLLPESSDRYPWALANLGLMHLETGRPDLALPMFETVVQRIGPDPLLLTYQASARQALGDDDGANALREQAARLAPPDDRSRYMVRRAVQLVTAGRPDEAIAALLEHGLPGKGVSPQTSSVLLDEGAGWTLLLEQRVPLPAPGRHRVAELVVMLGRVAQQAKASGHVTLHIGTVERLARLVDAARSGRPMGRPVGRHWAKAHELRDRHGLPADAFTLMKLAFDRYLHGDVRAGRRYLSQVPAAVAKSIGAVPDLSLVADEPARLAHPLGHLAHLLVLNRAAPPARHSGPRVDWSDLRFVAELQRDATGRVGVLRRAPHLSVFDEGLSDRTLARLAPKRGGLVVIEWLHNQRWWTDGPTGLRCLLTRVDTRGRVASRFLPQLDVDPPSVAVRLRTRLFGWGPRRRGDPLDEPEWQRLAEWIIDLLHEHAGPDDHIVIFENRWTAGLPWHTAVGPTWTLSYAPGWTGLFDFLSQPPPPRRTIGVLTVPRVGERPEVRTALQASATHAARLGVPALTPQETACDRAAFARVMRECDVALLLCHGYTSDVDREVALMLANRGELPLAGSVATGSAEGVGHRLSWRDCTGLPRASRTVFSAACSTGVSYQAGLGDRLGLFGALRHAGTTAIVAPGWDAVAAAVSPVLDDVVARFVAGEPLGRALQAACLASQSTQPPWLAWALTLEGDWR